jgi:hypothetical protein
LDPMHKWVGTYEFARIVRIVLLRFFKWLYYPEIPHNKRPKPEFGGKYPPNKEEGNKYIQAYWSVDSRGSHEENTYQRYQHCYADDAFDAMLERDDRQEIITMPVQKRVINIPFYYRTFYPRV